MECTAPQKSPPAWVNCVDSITRGTGAAALGGSVVSQTAGWIAYWRNSPVSYRGLFPYSGLLSLFAIGSMAWNGIRANDRLYAQRWQASQDQEADQSLLVGAELGVASILFSLLAVPLRQTRFSIALRTIAAILGGSGVFLDVTDLRHLYQRHLADPEQVTAGQVWLQLGLTLVMNLPGAPSLPPFPKGRFQSLEGQPIGNPFDLLNQKPVARGGLAVIFQVIDKRSGDTVALKIPLLRGMDACLAESRIARKIQNHGNQHLIGVIDAYYLGEGVACLESPWIKGRTLRELLESGFSLELTEAARMALQVVEGLRPLHRLGIQHRDVKPENLVIKSSDRSFYAATLIDLGVAGFFRRGREGVLGTVQYMAPEQLILGAPGSEAATVASADYFALGATVYEAITGMTRFPILEEAINTGYARPVWVAYGLPAPRLTEWKPTENVPGVAEFQTILDRLLELNPAQRYHRYEDLTRDLRVWINTFYSSE